MFVLFSEPLNIFSVVHTIQKAGQKQQAIRHAEVLAKK